MDSRPIPPSPDHSASGCPQLPARPETTWYPQPDGDSASEGTTPSGHRRGISALVIGILSVLCLSNENTVLGVFLLGPAGAATAISALHASRKRKTPVKGMVITGLVLSAVSFLIVLAQMVLNFVVIGLFAWAVSSDSWGTETPAEEKIQVPAAGPLPLGTAADLEDYTFTVTGINTNAADSIVSLGSNTIAPSGQNVLVEMTVTYNGSGEGREWYDFDQGVLGADGRTYQGLTCSTEPGEPDPAIYDPLEKGGSVTVQRCMTVPVEELPDAAVYVEKRVLPDFDSEWIFWSAE